MKQIPIDDAKERLLELIDPLDDEGLVVTKRGVPVARIVRRVGVDKGSSVNLIGYLEGKVEVLGDIYSTGVHYPEDCHKYAQKEDNS